MKENQEVLEIYQGLPKSYAVKSFNRFKNFFQKVNMDLKDVEQEILISILKYNRTNKFNNITKQDQVKLTYKIVKNTFRQLLRNNRKYDKKWNISDDEQFDELESIGNNNTQKPTFQFDDLKNILTDTEYDIIYDKFHNNMTDIQIGEKIGVSKQYIGQILVKILSKVEKKMKFYFTFEQKPH